jgi:hypothetical protein
MLKNETDQRVLMLWNPMVCSVRLTPYLLSQVVSGVLTVVADHSQ